MDTRRGLYHARINSHLTLEQIGVRTALSPSVLRNIDEGKFERLPSGVYARSYVRTFAAAVGLDPETALADVEHLLPGAPDPIPALNAIRPDPAEWASQLVSRILQAVAALVVNGAASVHRKLRTLIILARPVTSPISRLAAAQTDPLRRLHLRSCARLEALAARLRALNSDDLTARLVARADAVHRSVRGRWNRETVRSVLRLPVGRLQGSPRLTRVSAAAIDALLLVVVDGFLILLVSFSSGIPLDRLLSESGWALGSFCAIPVGLYFLLFGGIAGSTLGGYICSLLVPDAGTSSLIDRPDHPLTLPEILRRTVKQ